MTTCKELITRGEEIREQGNIAEAMHILRSAIQAAESTKDLSNARRHLGLCYEHMGNLANAENQYKLALNAAYAEVSKAEVAICKRHLLSIELKRGNLDKALEYGKEAREAMLEMWQPPADLVWVTHGIVKVLIVSKAPKKELRSWLELEESALEYAREHEKKEKIFRIWQTGYFMHVAKIYPLLAPFYMLAALWIAHRYDLGLRMTQMFTGKR
jgi:tetratricopeptide (TPR) repeat protein